MAIDNFIPQIWSAGVTKAFQLAQVIIPTVNRDYEGDASKGNTVNITGAITPTIVDYADNGRTIDAEDISDGTVQLLINQEKAFAFKVDDVDKTQAAGSFDTWTQAAGGALAEEAEATVLAAMVAEAGTNLNPSGSGQVAVDTADEALAALRAIRTKLTKNKVPAAGRFVAVNPAFADLVIAKLSDVAVAGDAGELRNGVIGRIYGMTIIETPMFAEATKPVAVGYHTIAVAFVAQIAETEALRDPSAFKDIIRGLNVYGVKVVRPEAVVKYISA